MITLTLSGRPISINHLYKVGRSRGGRMTKYMTAEGKNAKEAWALEAKVQLVKQRAEMFLHDNLSVTIKFYFEDKKRRDADNYSKALLDCLSDLVWKDDKQIMTLYLEKHLAEEGAEPHTELFIRELTNYV